MLLQTILPRKDRSISNIFLQSDEIIQALHVLAKHELTHGIKSTWWALLKSNQQPLEIRLTAAELLMPANEEIVLDYLNTELIQHLKDNP